MKKALSFTSTLMISIVIFYLSSLLIPGSSFASDASVLRIETGMHTAAIKRIGIDAQNRFLITGSYDKTVRVWELKTGTLLKTLRPPIGKGYEGRIFAVAISPDGRTVAAGGWTGFEWDGKGSIYLFDRATGTITGRIKDLPNVINHLSFSPDGRFLAAALGAGNGVRVFKASRGWELTGEDRDYGSDSYWADFSHNGKLITTCDDGYIRLYKVREGTLKLLKKTKAPGGKKPFSAMFSPNGSKIAVGFKDSTKVNVLSARDLSHLYSPDTSDVDNGNLGRVAWSHDGSYLYAGGRYNKSGTRPILSWSQAGQGRLKMLDGSNDVIMHILPLIYDGVVFGAGDPAFGILSSSGTRTLFKSSAIADHRDNQEGFKLSWNGKSVRFGYEQWGKSPAVFDLTNRRLNLSDISSSDLYSPNMKSLNITDWKYTYAPKLNGTPLKLDQYEMSRAIAVHPAKKGFLLGAEWSLRYFDTSANELWNKPVPGTAWTVNIAKNGKIAAAAFSDGTIRWYRVSDGEELLAFFPHNDRKRWVLWTPSGYYDASIGAEDLIGWHVNNGQDHEADFFPVSRFRNQFYRPDVISKVLDCLDESEAVQLADAEANRKHRQRVDIRKQLPPVVRIHSPYYGQEFRNKHVTITYSLRNPSGAPIKSVQAIIDGRRSGSKGRPVRPDSNTLKVVIPERDCEIGLIAENQYGASEPALVSIKWKGRSNDEFVIKPKLYMLAVGVSRYKDKSLKLRYAAKDAVDMAGIMKKQKGGLYRDVEIKLLTDRDADKDNILDGLEWLQRETTSKDVAALFLSGHGLNDTNGVYYFLPSNFNDKRIKRTGLMFGDIKNTISSIAGKIVVFADTCHSGNIMGGRKGMVDINAFVNELASAENGAIVFTSSTGKQISLERPEWSNGAFTKALVEGISGKAAYGSDKERITINMLDLYISERVKELTDGLQSPSTTKPKTVPDFPIALKR
jgi:WD40 repeat protein